MEKTASSNHVTPDKASASLDDNLIQSSRSNVPCTPESGDGFGYGYSLWLCLTSVFSLFRQRKLPPWVTISPTTVSQIVISREILDTHVNRASVFPSLTQALLSPDHTQSHLCGQQYPRSGDWGGLIATQKEFLWILRFFIESKACHWMWFQPCLKRKPSRSSRVGESISLTTLRYTERGLISWH